MLVFTGKYGTDDLNPNKYRNAIKINYAKVSVYLYTWFGKFLVSEIKYFS